MNRLVVKRVVTGGGLSSSSAAATPFDMFGAAKGQSLGLSVGWRRLMSSASEPSESGTEKKGSHDVALEKVEKGGISSYWGIARPKITREDGTEWVWNCFMRRYGCRAMMLETVAAVPGMVGGMLLHLRSLRKFQQSGGWIKALLEEAENERMHLMTMVELVQPKWYERFLVLTVQGVFFNAFFVLYLMSPKLAHRVVGYLEEEAVHSYTEYLKDIESGAIKNVPAPAIAIDYWRLPKDATLKDVIIVIRADEAHHRDVNHFASDVHFQGKELREAPAPLGYH
ncbi:ubiquinol oxidase, mitochondrial-like isoform X2 [Primulina huaijiensis]|uniref:ubiquinol oxidase, mitochondrial-like isoform X2 n=1 Tax=Primulina huaijiensis TaxID=1492673 RepID=UPI003CC78E54